jgi:hypothetical protein
LQYDEINRVIVPPATPPVPGTFQADYRAILSTASNGGGSSAPHGGIEGFMSSIMSNPEQAMARMSLGNLVRYTYYKGWMRTDDPVAQRATIEKCEQHQYIVLDLAKKTYAIQSTQPPCPTTEMPGARPGGDQSQPAQPGSADLTVTGASSDLGALSIDGIATTGADYSMQMQTTNATGSCRDGDFKMAQTRYVSQIRVPRPYCPLPKTMTGAAMVSPASRGGCEPRMHVSGTPSGFNDFGRLVMYSRMGFGQNNAMAMVVERGNVTWLSGGDADALFTIPPGFTRAP